MSEIIPSAKTYGLVWAALLVLLLLSVSAYMLPLGGFGVLLNFGVALLKTTLIMLFFMQVRDGPRLNWVFAGLGFYWLAILLTLSMSDFATRAWLPMPGK